MKKQTQKPTSRFVEFRAQIAPGKGAVSFEGTRDGAEIKILVPEMDKHLIAEVPFYFIEKKLRVRLEVMEDGEG